MSPYTNPFKWNSDLALFLSKVQSSTCITYRKYLWYLFKMAMLTLKSDKVLGRVGCIFIFSKKKNITWSRVFCFFILLSTNQPYSIVTSSSFKSQDFWHKFVQLVRNLCFDWNLIESLPVFFLKEFSQKARKPMSITLVL